MAFLPLSSRSPTTSLKQPKQAFCFARTQSGGYEYDQKKVIESHLNYYYLPDSVVGRGIDLSAGHKSFNKIPEEQNLGDFGSYLAAIQRHEEATQKKVDAQLISFRGIMRQLLTLVYADKEEQLNLNLVPFDNQLFIHLDSKLELEKRQRQNNQGFPGGPDQDIYRQQCEYSGYKFETIATLEKPWAQCSRREIESRSKKTVGNYEEFLSVVRTGVADTRMLLCGEVDCVWDYYPDSGTNPLLHYAELKTLRIVELPKQAAQFEKKLFNTWAQCFLVGIHTIVYGFRDRNLMLKNVEVYDAEQIPTALKALGFSGPEQKYNCIAALKWFAAAIKWIFEQVDVSNDQISWRLSYEPAAKSLKLERLSQQDNDRLRQGDMLTPEFIEWRQSLK